MTRRHTPESLERRIVRTSADWSCVGLRLIDYLAGRFTYRDAAAWREVIATGEIMVNHAAAVPERAPHRVGIGLFDLIGVGNDHIYLLKTKRRSIRSIAPIAAKQSEKML